jgi:hypothetical protein
MIWFTMSMMKHMAQGISKVPVIECSDIYSPVITNLALKLAHILKDLKKLQTVQFNIETTQTQMKKSTLNFLMNMSNV